MKHYIFCQEPLNVNKGGVVGYLSQLYLSLRAERLLRTKAGIDISFLFPVSNIKQIEYPIINEIDEIFADVASHQFLEFNFFNKNKFINRWSRQFRTILPYSEIRKIDTKNIKSFHIHGAYNFAPVYNTLFKLGLQNKVVKILSTHNPFKPAIEDLELISRDCNWTKKQGSIIQYFLSERDRLAYSYADALIFPSEESFIPYFDSWPEFREIIKNKKVYFCETGSSAKPISSASNTLRRTLGIPESALLFLYLGRFIPIRGYDLLIEAAKQIIPYNKNIYFLIVGEKREVPLNSKQWIQVPYTKNPGDYLAIADFVLAPNRGSYFDLSMIEALAASVPLLCARVGGYKWLQGKTSGAIFFEPGNTDDFISKILEVSKLKKLDLKKLGDDNRNLYENKLTPKHFAVNYTRAIEQIYSDFNIDNAPNTPIISPELTFDDNSQGLGLIREQSVLKQILDGENKGKRAYLIARFLENRFGIHSRVYQLARKIYWKLF